MEDRLTELIKANNETERTKTALEWKRRGKKVIGILCPYVPEEVIYAAGMLPWRITGNWRAGTPSAAVYRPQLSCLFCSHVLESLLQGEYGFLDGVVATNRCDDMRRLWDVWAWVKKTPYTHIMHLPHIDSELGLQAFGRSIDKLLRELQEFGQVQITTESLASAIKVYNRWRSISTKVYELRKKEVPPISGREALALTTAAFVMPKDRYAKDLEALLPYLEKRKAPAKQMEPRILVASDMLDSPDYIKAVEDAGSMVVMDDMDTGSRYFWQSVDENQEPVRALAQRYINRPACPRMLFHNRQVDKVIEWCREYRVDAVLNLVQMYCYPRWFASPYFINTLKKAGIPAMTFMREYQPANMGQLQTRFQAFLETLK